MGKKRLSFDHSEIVYAAMSPNGRIALATIRPTALEAAAVNADFNPSVDGYDPPARIVKMRLVWDITDTMELPV